MLYMIETKGRTGVSMKSDIIFPDNWKELVREKKVILYNTGVSSLLGGREKRIKKMKWVFQVFKDHPEVVLWWRPHPLEVSTLQSMLPELEEQYMEVRQQYIEEGIGILDESVDLNRAIAVSDAYYGTWSSVAELYKAAGKPVLFENNTIFDWHKELFFDVTDFVLLGSDVWFLSSTMNILFVMNLDTFELTEAIRIPYGNILGKYMSYRMAVVGGYLVLIPGCGKWIIRLNVNERKFDKLEIGKYVKSIRFCAYAVYDECVYMLPAFANRIIKYNAIRNEIICERTLREHNSDLLLETITEVTDSYIYAVEAGGNHIYKYDMQNDAYEKIELPDKDICLFGIRKAKDLFVLVLSNKNEILLWNEKENRTWKMEAFPEGYSDQDRPLCDLVKYKEDIYLFPDESDQVFKINTDQMVLEQCSGIEEKERGVKERYFTRAKNIGNEIMAFSYWHNQWVVLNPEENLVIRKNVIVKDGILDRIADYSIFETDNESDGQGVYYAEDQDFYSLQNYIRDVFRVSVSEQNTEKKEAVGEKIHKTVAGNGTTK